MKVKWVLLFTGLFLFFVLGVFVLFGLPFYSLWKADMDGKARLIELEYSNKVETLTAKNGISTAKYSPLRKYLENKTVNDLGDIDPELRRILIAELNQG